LIPEAVNTRKIGRDVEKVADLLTTVPGFQFAKFLREVIVRARRSHVLPPASKPASPSHQHMQLPSLEPSLAPSTTIGPGISGSGFTPTALSNGNGNGVLDFGGFASSDSGIFDFGYAEQLFNNGPAANVGGALAFDTPNIEPAALFDGTINLNAWFPFPPLESDGSLTMNPSPSNSTVGNAPNGPHGPTGSHARNGFVPPNDGLRNWW